MCLGVYVIHFLIIAHSAMWPSKDGINTARLIIRGINSTVGLWILQRPVPARSWKLDCPGFLCPCFFPTWLNFELGKNFNHQGDCMSESLPVWCKDYENSRIQRVQVLCEELALWLDIAYEKCSVNSSYFWRCAARCAERVVLSEARQMWEEKHHTLSLLCGHWLWIFRFEYAIWSIWRTHKKGTVAEWGRRKRSLERRTVTRQWERRAQRI